MAEEHLEEILQIENLVYPNPWSRASFAAELSNHMAHYLVLLLNERVVGYAGQWLVLDEAHITTVAVAPEHRRKGYGRLLVCELLYHALQKGMTRVTLEVRVSNAVAKRLYEKYQFQTVAIREKYYPDREDAYIMWLNVLQEPWYRELLDEARKGAREGAGISD